MNFLLVEDDPTDMKLLSAVIVSGGHTVLQRSTAELAIESLQAAAFDAVVIDLKLPKMGGLALARQIKTNEETRHIPLLAVTAAVDKFKQKDAIAAGFDAFFVKPIATYTSSGDQKLAETVGA